MSLDSVNPVAESVKQVSPQEDVAPKLKKPGNSTKNDYPKQRKDKGTVHTTHCGLLSRDIVRALVRSGESLRNLRRYEKQFRAVFKPRGTLGELIFDRWWSSYLRLHLLARLEAKMLAPNESHRRPAIEPELREGNLPTLITASELDEFENAQRFDSDLPQDLFRQLVLVPRYDAHFARDGNRMAALLLLMRKGGNAALEQLIAAGLDFTKVQGVRK